MTNESECKHELACRKCDTSIDEIGLAAADKEDERIAAACEAADEELAKLLVTTVRVERYAGVHEGVTVWLRGMNVGTLTVGDGEGERLRALLLSEQVVAKARTLIQHWKDQDGFNSGVFDDLMSEVDLVDRLVLAEQRSEAAS